ncbi:MAG: beta-lactamase family protein [Butyrivibrio sp.]|nr:beta-lactamase family protein [Butyrivibrio sp.]
MFEFARAIPEDAGVSSTSIVNVLNELDKKAVPMHSILIMKGEKLIFEKYYTPYTKDTLHRMFSISKSFTAVAIALLAEDGKLSFDDPVAQYFPEYITDSSHPWITEMTIRNMLMMRTCHASTTYKVNMKEDWVKSFFTVPPTHKSGTVFHYDTSSAHTLCALVEKLTGSQMLDYMRARLLDHMDFSANAYMVKDPFGVSMGGSGLMATPVDVLKLLYFLKKGGRIKCSDGHERQLLSKELIDELTKNSSDTFVTAPLPSEAQGYGMQIWQNEKGGFVLYGMGGQLGISIPSEDLLVMTTADTQGMQGGNQLIYNAIYDNLVKQGSGLRPQNSESPEASQSYQDLLDYAHTLSIAPPRLPENYIINGITSSPYTMPVFMEKLFSRSDSSKNESIFSAAYHLEPNKNSFETLALIISDSGSGTMTLTQKDTQHSITFGIGKMCSGLFPIYNTPYTAGAMWPRENILYIRAHLIGESVGSIHFELYFEEAEVTIFMRKIEETYFSEFEGHLHGLKD